MYRKERLAICNEEDADGRARATTDEERVQHVGYLTDYYAVLGLNCNFLQAAAVPVCDINYMLNRERISLQHIVKQTTR